MTNGSVQDALLQVARTRAENAESDEEDEAVSSFAAFSMGSSSNSQRFFAEAGGEEDNTPNNLSQLVLRNQENRLMAFESPAADLLAAREYQGLLPNAPANHSTSVQQGHFGIAASYEKL